MGANISLGKPIEEVPEHGKQVTLEFLNKHWSENIATAQVEPVLAETREGVYKEDGGGASGPNIVRVLLTWKDGKYNDDQPESCVLKSENNLIVPKEPFATRLIRNICDFISVELQANEQNWYRVNSKIAVENGYSMPRVYCTVRSHNLVKRPNARQLVVRDSRQNFRTCTVMEDLKNYKSPPQQKNLSKEQVKAALKNMAALHSAYWGKVDDYEWIDGSTTRACTWLQNVLITVDPKLPLLGKGKLNFHKSRILEDIVKMYDTPLGNKLYHEFCDGKNWLTDDDTLAALFAFRKRLQDDDSARNRVINTPLEYQTLIHGDCHGWNHMFLKEENSTLPAVKAVDFGMVGNGRPTWDVAYFMSQSVDGTDYESDLEALRVYYDALVSAVDKNPKFDSNAYTFDAFQAEYFRVFATYLVGTLSLIKNLLTPKYLEKQRLKKNDDGKGESLTYLTIKLHERIFQRTINYHKKGVFEKL